MSSLDYCVAKTESLIWISLPLLTIKGEKVKKEIKTLIITALLYFAHFPAYAFPIAAPGTEGSRLFGIGAGLPVTITYLGGSAAHSIDLYLMEPSTGALLIFSNDSASVGDTKNIGEVHSGSELWFRVHVNDTGYDFFNGSREHNADGEFHARVQRNWLPNTALASFEAIYDPSGNSSVFDDLSFSVSNVNVIPIPEPETYAMFLAGLGLLGWRLRNARSPL